MVATVTIPPLGRLGGQSEHMHTGKPRGALLTLPRCRVRARTRGRAILFYLVSIAKATGEQKLVCSESISVLRGSVLYSVHDRTTKVWVVYAHDVDNSGHPAYGTGQASLLVL